MRADANDAALVEIEERFFRDVRNFARDLFLAALRIADVQLELLDVDRRIDVVLHQALREHDGVFEVVPVPRHERDGDVRAERELPRLGRRAVGQHVAGLHLLSLMNQRTLVDRRVLVRAPVLLEAIPVVLREARERTIALLGALLPLDRGGVDDDLVGRDARDDAGSARDDDRARVACATLSSSPVPTSGVRGLRSGTAWRCMFEPINARFASSCSRNGMSAAAIETSCSGATSM